MAMLMNVLVLQTWNPMSKHEPHAHSAADLVSFAKEAIENFFDIPIAITEGSFHALVDGVQNILREYIAFVASCGEIKNITILSFKLSIFFTIFCSSFRIKTELHAHNSSTNKVQPRLKDLQALEKGCLQRWSG